MQWLRSPTEFEKCCVHCGATVRDEGSGAEVPGERRRKMHG